MRHGFACEDCGEVVWLAQGPTHLRWLRDREHVAREVGEHSSAGLDLWMTEGLRFFDEHRGHSILMVSAKSS